MTAHHAGPHTPSLLSGRWLVVQTKTGSDGDVHVVSADGPYHCRRDAEAAAACVEDTGPPSTSWTVLHASVPPDDDMAADRAGAGTARGDAPKAVWPRREPDPAALRAVVRRIAAGRDGGRDTAVLVLLVDQAVLGSTRHGRLDGLLGGTDAEIGREAGLGRQRAARALASLVRQGLVRSEGPGVYGLTDALRRELRSAQR